MFKILLLTSTTAALGAGVLLFFKYVKKSARSRQTIKIPPSEVIFFTNENSFCRNKCLRFHREKVYCGENCSIRKLEKLVAFIDNAQKTLDLCLYLITCNDLSYAIIRAFKRGVQVRVILDKEMSTSSESKYSLFINSGIPVRTKKSYVYMHHKFCVIDFALPKRKLLTGSLNWTMQGLAGNYEYVTIISHPVPVFEYQKEFNNLWEEFSPKHECKPFIDEGNL